MAVFCPYKADVVLYPECQECDGRPYSFGYDLPAYGVAVFEF